MMKSRGQSTPPSLRLQNLSVQVVTNMCKMNVMCPPQKHRARSIRAGGRKSQLQQGGPRSTVRICFFRHKSLRNPISNRCTAATPYPTEDPLKSAYCSLSGLQEASELGTPAEAKRALDFGLPDTKEPVPCQHEPDFGSYFWV